MRLTLLSNDLHSSDNRKINFELEADSRRLKQFLWTFFYLDHVDFKYENRFQDSSVVEQVNPLRVHILKIPFWLTFERNIFFKIILEKLRMVNIIKRIIFRFLIKAMKKAYYSNKNWAKISNFEIWFQKNV